MCEAGVYGHRPQGNPPGTVEARELLPLVIGDLTVNPAEQVAQAPGGSLRLTGREFRLLQHLMLHEGQAVSTESILLSVWGYADSNDRALLKQLVYRLRQKLASVGARATLIEAVPGIGYRLSRTASVHPEDGDEADTASST